jgi:simple sugar transport system permease protein
MTFEGQNPSVKNFPAITHIAHGFFLGLPFSLTLVAIVMLAVGFLARQTAAGLFIESTGSNLSASHYAGVNTKLVQLLAYAVTGLLSGVAGLWYVSNIVVADANNAGLYLELDAILAVVIGGTALTGGRFYLIGSLIGAVVIQTLTTTILMVGIPPEYNLVIKAIVVLAVCLLQSDQFRAKLFRRKSN